MKKTSKLGENLRRLRTQAGLTQTELGKQVEVSTTTISKFETGHMDIPSAKLVRICNVLHTTSDELLGRASGQAINASGLTQRQTQALVQLAAALREDNLTR